MKGEIKIEEKYERNGWPALARPDITSPEGWNLSLLAAINRVRNHSLSPDGKRIAFVWDREEFSDIFIIPAEGGWPARLSFDRPVTQYWWDEIPYWSPDSQWLAFIVQNQVNVVAASGGLPKRVTNYTPHAYMPRWMPDSNGLVAVAERTEGEVLLLTDRNGSWPWSLTSGPGDDRDPQPSPDGKWIAFVHRPLEDLNCWDICVFDNVDGKTRNLTSTSFQKDWSPRWSPDGKTIAFLSQRTKWNEIWELTFPEGEVRQLTNKKQDFSDITWSPDGRWLAATINREGAIDLVLVDSKSGVVHTLRDGKGVFARPNWAPDKSYLTVEYSDPITPPDIYRVDLEVSKNKPIVGQITQLTFSKPPAIDNLSLVHPEVVMYPGFDGVQIPAFLFKPKTSNGAAIVNPHGGPRDQTVFEWDLFPQYLVAKGYTVLMPNYRGSTGYGKDFEYLNQNRWGVGDAKDCLAAAKYLGGLEGIDDSRLAVMGASYGGYLTICSLTRDPEYLFACGVCIFGDSNLITSWAQCDRDTRLYTEMQIGHPAKNWDIYTGGSPINEVENLQKPILLLHGLEDKVVPPQASEELVEAMKRAGKTYEYKTYAGETHGFLKRENVLDAYARIERFLDWYLMP